MEIGCDRDLTVSLVNAETNPPKISVCVCVAGGGLAIFTGFSETQKAAARDLGSAADPAPVRLAHTRGGMQRCQAG